MDQGILDGDGINSGPINQDDASTSQLVQDVKVSIQLLQDLLHSSLPQHTQCDINQTQGRWKDTNKGLRKLINLWRTPLDTLPTHTLSHDYTLPSTSLRFNYESFFRSTSTLWIQLLPPYSLAFLAATSKSMLGSLSPQVEFYLIGVNEYLQFQYPTTEGGAKLFKQLQPNSFTKVKPASNEIIPSFVTRLHLDDHLALLPCALPPFLTHLIFGRRFDQPLNDTLPPTLTHLTFGSDFNQYVDCLPAKITHLTFGSCFNKGVDHLPPITHLTFGYQFQQSVENLPKSLLYLYLCSDFTGSIYHLPPHLKTLICPLDLLPSSIHSHELHGATISPVNNSLPSSLTSMHLNRYSNGFFDIAVDDLLWKPGCFDSLPAALRSLHLSCSSLNIPMDALPASLTQLELDCEKFNHPLNLPHSVTHFTFYSGIYIHHIEAHRIPGVTHLSLMGTLNWVVDSLPSSLTHLVFGEKFNRCVDNLPPRLLRLTFGTFFNKNVDKLPSQLTHLSFGAKFNETVDKLPLQLTHLTFIAFNLPVPNLPPNITHLSFGYGFDYPIDNLPASLTHLSLGSSFNQPVNHLPPSLTYLSFGYSFNIPVSHLPPSLTYLSFGKMFNQKLDPVPPSLQHLSLGRSFAHPLHLPLSLTHLTLVLKTRDFPDSVFFTERLQELTLRINRYTAKINLWRQMINLSLRPVGRGC